MLMTKNIRSIRGETLDKMTPLRKELKKMCDERDNLFNSTLELEWKISAWLDNHSIDLQDAKYFDDCMALNSDTYVPDYVFEFDIYWIKILNELRS